jgi:intracellular septation protein
VNKSFIKFITDFGPLLIFFIYYYRNDKDISVAIPPLIIATLIAVVIAFFLEKKIPFIPLLGAILVSVFGGLSLYFNNPVFIYLKPTIINLIFAVILIIGQRFFQKNLIQMLLSKSFQMNEEGWKKLNYRWAYFFIFLAFLNELVWRTQTESIWVNFKVWGILPLTIVFTAAQIPLINKHKHE